MYDATEKFIKALESRKAECRFFEAKEDKGDNAFDTVVVKCTCEFIKANMRFCFAPENSNVSVHVLEIAKFPEDKMYDVMREICRANAEHRWFKFCIDDTDNTISIESDALITPSTSAAVCTELMKQGVDVINKSYRGIMRAIWA